MNIFCIPSWYPSADEPLTGIFVKEQMQLLANHYPDMCIGVSLWGQQDERLLLWAKDGFKNLSKWYQSYKILALATEISPNYTHFFSPALTWTRKIAWGNLHNLLRANRDNATKFEKKWGKIDIIHAHVGFPAGYIAAQIGQEKKIPYLITEHMSPFPFPYYEKANHQLYAPLALAFRKAQKNIAVSPALVARMQLFGIKNIAYIPNPVDETFFYPADSKAHNPYFNFFALGRMVAQKGIENLLKATQIVIQKYPKCRINIGGEGENWQEYQQLAQKLQLTEHINWLGWLDREEVRQQLWQADAFVLPSLHETMGIVYAEALACAVPVVATLNGGAESVINEQSGYLSAVGDVEALAKNMLKMIENRHLFNEQTIRQDFEKRFASKLVCQQIRTLYEQMI